jgi:hypothetical protein
LKLTTDVRVLESTSDTTCTSDCFSGSIT